MKVNQCIKVVFSGTVPTNFFEAVIQSNAKKFLIEGTVQAVTPTQVHIIACGSKDYIDQFLDVLHKGLADIKAQQIIIEPFVKAKDYRGVFRIIQ